VSLADDLEAAEASAEAEVGAIQGKLFHRRDVGTTALVSRRRAPTPPTTPRHRGALA
jgi:phosphoribosylamine-glycine ligase